MSSESTCKFIKVVQKTIYCVCTSICAYAVVSYIYFGYWKLRFRGFHVKIWVSFLNWWQYISSWLCFQEGPQRKKRKSEAVLVEEKADLLAMGTAAGTVLIYSTAKGALQCTLVSGRHAQLISQNPGYSDVWLRDCRCHRRLPGWRPQWRSQLCSVAPWGKFTVQWLEWYLHRRVGPANWQDTEVSFLFSAPWLFRWWTFSIE